MVRQSAESAEQDLGSAPRWGGWRHVNDQLVPDLAEAPVDVGFIGQFLFEQANPEARHGSFQCVELQRQVHGLSVRPKAGFRNLVVLGAGLLRWCDFDSTSKTMDRRR